MFSLSTTRRVVAFVLFSCSVLGASDAFARGERPSRFVLEEATIAGIQTAIVKRQLTTTDLVGRYLERIKAYNGTCVNEPNGILGAISTIPNAGQLNALTTLNLRPAARVAWGFGERKARSMTDPVDDDPNMPDALETAAALDAYFARTGKFVGPLHGVVMAIKDQYDTVDMRTTSGADAFWANDRPPDDATFVKKLREAGAVIIGKANMGEYAAGGITGTRSSFGGTICNAYDTERDPGASSGGSGVAVAANLVTCAIGEETGTSVREPAKNNNAVGIAPTRELVSADGMMERGITTRVGPICRTVEDTARILDVYAGFDPKDEMTSFSVGRKPPKSYPSYTKRRRLDGVRIGVVREYMDKRLFTAADSETIDIVERAIGDLAALGATIVDPGPSGALFQECVDKFSPVWRNRLFTGQFPTTFPVTATGTPTTDHITTLVELFFDPAAVPKNAAGQPSIRNLGSSPGDSGGSRYNWNVYLAERGDAEIRTLTDLIQKANFWQDPAMPNRLESLVSANAAQFLATGAAQQTRFTLQTVMFQCFAEKKLDAVVYPTGNVPPAILTAPQEPTVNDRSSGLWTYINSRGFPALTVPAGFTTVVYDRATDGSLLPPIPSHLPVGIDFLGLPFTEAKLFEIGAAYETATKHRVQPPGFGPLPSGGSGSVMATTRRSAPRPMPMPRVFSEDELEAITQD